jgi:dTDP-4-amino-4,6-dideoxygalactose transaminase
LSRPFIPFNRPYLGDAEKSAVMAALESGHIGGNGPVGAELQRQLAALLGVKHVLLTTSCSHALEMAMIVFGVGPGDEVIMPSFAFVSAATAVVRSGGRPVFAEIDETTHNLDPRDVESRVTSRTKGLMPVHYAGQGCAMDALMDVARRHNLWVVEDAAQGLGASFGGRQLGTIGDVGCFSFHVTKNIVCGEGGAFVTNNDETARRAEIVREKGTDRSRFLRGEVDKYTWVDLGSSYIPSDLLAALALAQLGRMDEIQQLRRAIWLRYQTGLEDLEKAGKILLPRVDPQAQLNWHIFAFRMVDPESRDVVLSELRNRQVGATFHYVPLHSAPYAVEHWGYRPGQLPITEKVSASLVRLPIYPDLSADDQDYVIDSVHDIMRSL